MKKTLVSALTTALVVGAASTTFAAANPFEDVPADHWAYDAVAQLAADGVIEGYGDGTYRGDQEITRYEMAQMVARAMAKGANGADKALIDKLAAEFADELNNLGVRVAALEKKVDNVKWDGMVRYRYKNRHEENSPEQPHGNANELLLRLQPHMTINKNWTAHARIDYTNATAMNDAANLNGGTNGKVNVDRAWAQGDYTNFTIKLGKFPVKTAADYGMTYDYRLSGGEVTFGKDIKVSLRAGRAGGDTTFFHHGANNSAAGAASADGDYQVWDAAKNKWVVTNNAFTYYGIEVFNDRAQKFTWGLGWQHVGGGRQTQIFNIGENLNIFNVGLGYKFDKNFNATAAYAAATGLHGRNDNPAGIYDSKGYKQSAAIQLNYKGANKAKAGSWGAYVAYRHLGDAATLYSTYTLNGPQWGGEKGFEVGASYAFAKNIVGVVQYFNGKELASGNKVNNTWLELGFYF